MERKKWAESFHKFRPVTKVGNRSHKIDNFPTDDLLRPEDFTPSWFSDPKCLSMEFGITQGCTDACWYCNYGRHNIENPISLRTEFALDVLDKFADQGGLAVGFTHLGEAFFHEGFREILEGCVDHNLRIKNVSNGTKLMRPTQEVLDTYAIVDHQRFSVDSVDDKSRSWSHHTGATTKRVIPGIYERYMRGLEVYMQHLHKSDIRHEKVVGATILIAPYMLEDSSSLTTAVGRIKNIGMDYIKLRPILDEGELSLVRYVFSEEHIANLERQILPIREMADDSFWVKMSDFSDTNVRDELTYFYRKLNKRDRMEKCWISAIRPHIDPASEDTMLVFPCLRATWDGSESEYQRKLLSPGNVEEAFRLGNHPVVDGCNHCCNEALNRALCEMEDFVKEHGSDVSFVSLPI